VDRSVVITGIGMVTPLGSDPERVLDRIASGESAVGEPSGFDAAPFDCRFCCEVTGFDAEAYFPENKTLRLMNRDAQLAVAAAHLAVRDAGLSIGSDYDAAEVALFGTTGFAGMPVGDVARLVRNSAGADGGLDLRRFGREALRRIRPVLSFKILANMPICFVSIFEGIRGPNAVYTPWEGQGARAVAAGMRAIRSGRVPCAVVGGCDVKTHAFAFITLQQQGVFRSWRQSGKGTVPGEGAAFVVLEERERARRRGARIRARVVDGCVRTTDGEAPSEALSAVLAGLGADRPDVVVAAGDGEPVRREAEDLALGEFGLQPGTVIRPKGHLGDLFAAAAAVQMCLGAAAARKLRAGRRLWVNCFGHGSEMGAFALEAV